MNDIDRVEKAARKTRVRQPVNELSKDDLLKPPPAIWDRGATVLHLVRAVAIPGTGLTGTQGLSQVWLRPANPGLAVYERSTGYVREAGTLGLEIQLEERSSTGVILPTALVFVPWANVAGITTR